MWQIKLLKRAEKYLENIDNKDKRRIAQYLDELITHKEPHKKGKALTGKLKGLWRFRVGDYRVIARIDGATITILVLDIGHRKDIYK